MTVENMQCELRRLLGGDERRKMLDEYDRIINLLGAPGASEKAARQMLDVLRGRS